MNSSESVSLEGFEIFRDEIFTRAQVSSAKSKNKLENLVLEKWRTLSLAQRLTYAETAKSFIKRKLETDSSSLSPSKKLKLDATIKKEPTIIDTVEESVTQTEVANETPVPENAVVDNLEKAVEDSDRSVEYDEILSSGCHICKVKFKAVQNYARHTKGKHSLVYISCKKCKTFYPQKSFKEHKCFKNNNPLQSSQNPGVLQNISNQVNLALNNTEKDYSNKDQSQVKEHAATPASEKNNIVNSVKDQFEKAWPDYIDAKSLKINGCPECKQIIKSGKYTLHLMDVHKVQYKFVMNSKDGKVDPKYMLINKPAADRTQVSVKTEPVEQRSDLLKIQPKLNPANVKITQPVQQKSDLIRTKPKLNATSVKTTEPNLLKSHPKLNLATVKTEPMDVEEVTSNEIVKVKISETDTTPKQIEKKSNNVMAALNDKNINSRPKSKTSGVLESSMPKIEVKNKKNIKREVNVEVTQEQETLNPKNILNDDDQISIVQENLLIQEEQIRTVIFQTEAIPMETTESSEADPLCDNVDNLGNTKDGSDHRSFLEVASRKDGNIVNSNGEDLISRKIPVLVDKLRSEIRQLLQEAKKKCLENPIVFSVDEDKDENIDTDSKESNEENSNHGEEGTEVTDIVLEEYNCESKVDDQKNVNDKELDSQEVTEDPESQEVGDKELDSREVTEDPESQEVSEDPQSHEFQEVEENSSNSLIDDADNNDQEDVEPTLDMEVTNENDDQINNQSDFNNYKKVISGRSTLQPSKLIFQKPVINFSSSSDTEDISKQESDLNSYKMIMSGKNTSAKKSNVESSSSTAHETTSNKIKEEEHTSNKIKEEHTSNKIKEEEHTSKDKIDHSSPKNEVSVIKANLPEKTEDNNNNNKTKRRNSRINNNKNKTTKKQNEKQENLNQAVSDVITYKLTPSEAVVKYKVTHSSLWMELVTNPADKTALARVGMAIEEEKKVVAAWQDLVRGLTGMEMMEKCENNTKEVMEYARFVAEEAGKEKVGEEWWLAFRKKHDLLWRKS